MRAFRSSLLAAFVTLAPLAAPASAAEAPFKGRDAREQLPAGMLGPWKADLAASTYTGTKPRVATRTFEYTADGKVLVTFQTVRADGGYTTGHWAAYTDGTPGIEYHNSAGSTPFNVVSFRKKDEAHFDLTVSRGGKVEIEATYALSADGKTLTYRYDGITVVYRRWVLE